MRNYILHFNRLICACRWNTLILFLHWWFLQFVRSWQCSPSFVVAGFVWSWRDKLFFPYFLLTIHGGSQCAFSGNLLTVALILTIFVIVVSMAILKILLIFSVVSTFVLRSKANIFDIALRKRFLLLSPLSNSSCTCTAWKKQFSSYKNFWKGQKR